ncbi:MAG: hypothetical protein IAE80_07950 [Anaerolinea sp.]|nr:hypothetical protein [Anaerolinea sp.]
MRKSFVFMVFVGCLFALISSTVQAQATAPQAITFDNAGEVTSISEIVIMAQRFGMRFTPVTDRLVVASDSGVTLYNSFTGAIDMQLIDGDFDGYAFTSDESLFYFSDDDGLHVLDMETMETEVLTTLKGGLVLSPDDHLIAIDQVDRCYVGGCTGQMILVDALSGEIVFSDAYAEEYLNDFAFSPDGSMFAYSINATTTWSNFNQSGTGFPSAVVHVVDLSSMEDLLTVAVDQGVLGNLFFTADGSQLVYDTLTMTDDSPEWSSAAIHVLNVTTGEEDARWALPMVIQSASPDGRYLHGENSVALPGWITFGMESGKIVTVADGEVRVIPTLFANPAFDPSSTLIAFGGGEDTGAVRFMSLETGDIVDPLGLMDVTPVFSVIFSPQGTLVAGQYTDTDNREEHHILIFGIPAGS